MWQTPAVTSRLLMYPFKFIGLTDISKLSLKMSRDMWPPLPPSQG